MGVSGCGKSTVGELLAQKLSIPFYDADDFHPANNIAKMAVGTPLTDDDRKPWLVLLADQIHLWQNQSGAVLACSALKQSYRDILISRSPDSVRFVYLKGDQELLASRLAERSSHFMPSSLLKSQLDTLEFPVNALTVDIKHPLEAIISAILKQI